MRQSREIILASGSPRRRELLSQLGLSFKVMPSYIDEKTPLLMTPEEIVRENAFQKAKHAGSISRSGLIIAADTLVALGEQVFGKPRDETEATRMLLALSGKQHQVYTAISVVDVDNNRWQTECRVTEVYMKELSRTQIHNYVATGEPLGKAGGYAIQGLGAIFIDRIDGCYTNVVGLSLPLLAEMLADFGVIIC